MSEGQVSWKNLGMRWQIRASENVKNEKSRVGSQTKTEYAYSVARDGIATMPKCGRPNKIYIQLRLMFEFGQAEFYAKPQPLNTCTQRPEGATSGQFWPGAAYNANTFG